MESMGQAIDCFAAVYRLDKGDGTIISVPDIVYLYFLSSQCGLPRLFWNNDRLFEKSQLRP